MQDIANAIDTITVKAAEEADRFIFEVIKPYCDYVSKREITKKDLELALTQYFSKDPCRNGHWIENDGWDGDVYYECSVCKEAFCMMDGTPVENMYYYCPHCGAAMAGEIERREE